MIQWSNDPMICVSGNVYFKDQWTLEVQNINVPLAPHDTKISESKSQCKLVKFI